MSTELQSVEPRTLYGICDDLQTWFETLESLKACPSDTPEADAEREQQITEVQQRIDGLGAELVTKTDHIAGVIRRMGTEQDAIKAELARLAARKKTLEHAEDWLRRYVVSVMEQRDMKTLKTATNTISLRQSDVVVITDADAVPMRFKTVTVKLPASAWALIRDEVSILAADAVPTADIQKSEVKKAIKAGAEVPGADIEYHTGLQIR